MHSIYTYVPRRGKLGVVLLCVSVACVTFRANTIAPDEASGITHPPRVYSTATSSSAASSTGGQKAARSAASSTGGQKAARSAAAF